MRKGPVPRNVFRILRLPIVNLFTRAALRRAIRKNIGDLPRDIISAAEGFFVPDMIGNIDFNQDKLADSFRITVNNAWFDQRLTGLKMALNGRIIAQESTYIRYREEVLRADKINRLVIDAGYPLELIVQGRKLGRGLHIVEFDLDLEITSQYFPVPVIMSKGQGKLPFLKGNPENLDFDVADQHHRAHFVPHIHYDEEWLTTTDVFRKVGQRNLLEAIKLLEDNPDYTFTVDQLPQLRSFAQSHPKQFAKLSEHVKSGRVEVVNGLYAEPDTNLVSGESLVRGSVLFQHWVQETFGKTCRVGWLIDSFGQSGQLPQILSKSGVRYLTFSRELEEKDYQADFVWEGLDGSRIQCHYMPLLYFAGYPIPQDQRRAFKRFSRISSKLIKHAAGEALFVPAGVDHGKPQAAPIEHIPAWNKAISQLPWSFSTPSKYFADVDSQALKLRQGEFQRIFEGVWSVRPQLKQKNRQAEAALEQTEALCTIASIHGLDYPHAKLLHCWETLLANQFHDRICGCVVDEVAKNIERNFDGVLTDLKHLEKSACLYITSKIENKNNDQYSFVVFNPLSFERSEWIEAEIPDAAGMEDHLLLSPEGPLEFQILDLHRYQDNSYKSMRIGFVAKLPPMGYRVFRFTRATDIVRPIPGDLKIEGDTVSGNMIKATVDLKKGTLTAAEEADGSGVYDLKRTGALVLEKDWGEMMIARIRKSGKKKENIDRVFWAEKGHLTANLRTEGTIGTSRFQRDIRFYRDLRRIDVRIKIDYRDLRHRLRVAVGTGVKVKQWTHEIPYGAIKRDVRELPAWRWADASTEKKGVTILNRGIAGHELVGQTAYLSLLRSQDKIHLFESGAGGFALGNHQFRFSVLPHSGDWRSTKPWQRGSAFQKETPVNELKGEQKGWGPTKSFLSVKPANVVLSALRRLSNDKYELRLTECSGENASATLALDFPVNGIEVTDLLGRKLADLPQKDGRVQIALGPFEIVTLHLSGK